LIVQRPSRSIWARRAGFRAAGTAPPLIVSFFTWVSRGRRASITVAELPGLGARRTNACVRRLRGTGGANARKAGRAVHG
jgi:hypothetical protein